MTKNNKPFFLTNQFSNELNDGLFLRNSVTDRNIEITVLVQSAVCLPANNELMHSS